ncbi:Hypothetical predicted protein [Pelobates cultripes]|uniref:Uncharacterized protein n=1 Tax=Pelobates cultripes TaxID=61616 RepID=A0AAD1S2P0_PELCU|nr:Hypothetical predicted protein [Pelobates cultripes]
MTTTSQQGWQSASGTRNAGNSSGYRRGHGQSHAEGVEEAQERSYEKDAGKLARNQPERQTPGTQVAVRNHPIDNSSIEKRNRGPLQQQRNPWRRTDAESSAVRKAAGEEKGGLARTAATRGRDQDTKRR